MFVGAAPSGMELIRKFQEKAPHAKFREGWGLSEVTALATWSPPNPTPLSVGLLLPNTQAKVVSVKTGQNLGPNQEGELCVKGPQVIPYEMSLRM